MEKHHFSKMIMLMLAISLFSSCENSKGQSAQKPNILVILVDEWRAQSTGYAGDPNVKTPHIDKLAAKSANFQYAVSGLPVCTPYRASFMTGQRPLTNGVFMNDIRLDTNALTIAEVLAHNGYRTGLIGKWHLDGQHRLSYTPPGPRRQGFQYWKAINCDHNYNHSAYYYNDDSTLHYWKGYDAIAETQDAKRYISRHAHKDNPFFLVLSLGPPHSPYHEAPEKYKKLYDADTFKLRPNVPEAMKKRVRHDLAGYYSQMSVLDDMVGQLIKKLKDEGVYDNTIIVFTSDHGDLMGSHGHYYKQRPYDESIRVPLLFHYSGKNDIENGVYDAMINAQDMMPTLLGLCGVKIPSTVEGTDFSDYLRGRKEIKDTVAFIMSIHPFANYAKSGGVAYRGVRTPGYTYVRDLNGPWLLFDNKKDPYQMHNLIGNPGYADIQKHFDNLLKEHLKTIHDSFLPGSYYVKKYHYPDLDPSGTVPYYKR